MAEGPRAWRGRFFMLNALKQIRSAFSLMNPDEVRERSERTLHIGLVATDSSSYSEMEEFFAPSSGRTEDFVHRAGERDAPDTVDLVVYEQGVPHSKDVYTFHRGSPAATVSGILSGERELDLALARQFPAFRKPVVDGIIQSVARENAFFSVVTALPDVFPSLAELPWAFGEFASDTAFLTGNQVRMAFQIAAACGHEVGYSAQKAQIAGIAGAAFGWRAIARQLAGKIPFGAGLIPKGAIAYAGTFVVGKGLERLHNADAPLTRLERRELYQQALEQGRSVAQSIASGAARGE